jgi:transcriptional regulator with XRE-family HTH domain
MNLKLKARIIERFGTQADFAQAMEIDDSIISKIVRGRRQLDPENQYLWAKVLRSTPRELFGRNPIG